VAFRGTSPALATAAVLGVAAILMLVRPGPVRGRVGGPERLVVDLNRAGPAELALLPGIGPARAAAIVENRRAHGPFPELVALTRVPGIGPATVAGLSGLARAVP
jgi:competence protein ComEA